MDEKVLIALVSLGAGWCLSQITDFVKLRWRATRLHDNLLTELLDIDAQLVRNIFSHQREIQFAIQGAMEPLSGIPIEAVIYSNSFGEAAPELNQHQRVSFALIHSMRIGYNKLSEELAEYVKSTQRTHMEEGSSKQIDRSIAIGGEYACALFQNAHKIRWHIRYHLDNSARPVLDAFGPTHRRYLEFLDELQGEVEKVKSAAEGLDRDALLKHFDEDAFNKIGASIRL